MANPSLTRSAAAAAAAHSRRQGAKSDWQTRSRGSQCGDRHGAVTVTRNIVELSQHDADAATNRKWALQSEFFSKSIQVSEPDGLGHLASHLYLFSSCNHH